jgi:hypothetical protein
MPTSSGRMPQPVRRIVRYADARTESAAALRLAAETGNTYQRASAHRELGDSHQADSHQEQARHHWDQALDLYTQLGALEVDEVRSRLNASEAAARH